MTGRMMDIYKDHLTEETVLLESAEDMLRAYSAAGIRIAGRHQQAPKPFPGASWSISVLAMSSIVWSAVTTGPERKPAPDMLLHAAAELDLHASRAMMVGDSPADIGAAIAAGMVSVGRSRRLHECPGR